MNRSFVVFLGLIFAAGVFSAQAQVVPAATGRTLMVNAGGEGSFVQPDYAGNGHAQASPYRLYGIGAFVDADFTRFIQIEAEGRWSHWNQCDGIAENTYMIGPRVPIVEDWKGLTPYGKFLFGWGSGSAWLNGRAAAWAYGGGVDYHLRHTKFTVRCFDFEFQDWQITGTTPHPYVGSVGLSYKVF